MRRELAKRAVSSLFICLRAGGRGAQNLHYTILFEVLSIGKLHKDYIKWILKFVQSAILHSCGSCGIIRTWREVRNKVNRLEKSLQKLEKVLKKVDKIIPICYN